MGAAPLHVSLFFKSKSHKITEMTMASIKVVKRDAIDLPANPSEADTGKKERLQNETTVNN